MSGHSKWATTKHKKAAIDAKRGKLFARLIKNIEVAARTGGGDPAGNPTLFDAIQKAKKNSVPADNITRAVKRGSGEEAGGADWQTIMYEGYGPNGVAFTRNNGSLADPGSVAYNFSRKGVVEVSAADDVDEDSILMAVLDAGAEEVVNEGEGFSIYCEPNDVVAVRTALTEAGMDYDSAEVQFVAGTKIEVDADTARKVMRLIDALEDSDDVQNVFTSMDISAEVAAELDADED